MFTRIMSQITYIVNVFVVFVPERRFLAEISKKKISTQFYNYTTYDNTGNVALIYNYYTITIITLYKNRDICNTI